MFVLPGRSSSRFQNKSRHRELKPKCNLSVPLKIFKTTDLGSKTKLNRRYNGTIILKNLEGSTKVTSRFQLLETKSRYLWVSDWEGVGMVEKGTYEWTSFGN